jgi:hypothetical protein
LINSRQGKILIRKGNSKDCWITINFLVAADLWLNITLLLWLELLLCFCTFFLVQSKVCLFRRYLFLIT